ncbi:MAG: hypothetical protein WAU68_05780 [Vitreimonas sp.]
MSAFHKISLLAGALAIVGASASAQTPDTPITVIGAINSPAHMQPVTDGRDDAVPEMPVVYDTHAQNTPAQAQAASARANGANETPAQPASTGGANLNQAVKSQ